MDFIGKINIFGKSEYLTSDIRNVIIESCPSDKLFLNFINKPPTKKLTKLLNKKDIKFDNLIYHKLSNNDTMSLSKNINAKYWVQGNFTEDLDFKDGDKEGYYTKVHQQYEGCDYLVFASISDKFEINLLRDINISDLDATIFIFYNDNISFSIWEKYFDRDRLNIFNIVDRDNLIRKEGLIEYKSEDLLPLLKRELKIGSIIN